MERLVSKYDVDEAISRLERGIVKYEVLKGICDSFFVFKRENKTSHRIYEDPWTGEMVNIQSGSAGDAKSYQQKQVVRLLQRRKGAN